MITPVGKTYTFYDASKQFLLTVKSEFLNRCWLPSAYDVYTLNTEYFLSKFLHNPTGPAIVDVINGINQYWINGKRLTDEDGETFALRAKYEDKLMDLIS